MACTLLSIKSLSYIFHACVVLALAATREDLEWFCASLLFSVSVVVFFSFVFVFVWRKLPVFIYSMSVVLTLATWQLKYAGAADAWTPVIDAPVIDAGTAVQRVRHAPWTTQMRWNRFSEAAKKKAFEKLMKDRGRWIQLADKLANANAATAKPSIDVNIGLLSDAFTLIDRYFLGKWQHLWDQEPRGSHYRSVEKTVSTQVKYLHRSRHTEVIIGRLRLGKCYLNAYLHQIGKHQDGLCNHCNEPETIFHFLTECSHSSTCLAVWLNILCNTLLWRCVYIS